MTTILGCIDFSDTSVPVIDETARLADALGARIVLLHVQPFEPDLVGIDAIGYLPTSPTVAVEQRPGYHMLQDRARRLQSPDRDVQTIYDEGLVVDQIIAQAVACDATIVVMGSHGHGALYHLLMGSVTEGVLRGIKRPVLVVPAPSPETEAEGE